MKQFFKFMFASMLGFILACVVVFFIFMGMIASAMKFAKPEEVKVSENTVLTLPLDISIEDKYGDNPFANFDYSDFSASKAMTLNEVVKTLDNAAEDPSISGIFMDISAVPTGFGNLEEIRNALVDFKSSGKFIYAYADDLTQKGYYIASVADSVFLNPVGSMEFKGLATQVAFFSGMLKKLDIEPQIIRHGKFKSAVEPFIQDKMSPENRLQTEAFLGSMWQHILQQISQRRNISVEDLNNIADRFLINSANDALEHKLVDRLVYRDQILQTIANKTEAKDTESIKFLKLSEYSTSANAKVAEISKDRIAVIYASGNIIKGKGKGASSEVISDEKVSKLIRKVRNDDKIKAVVFRINSPGGDALASEVIWREAKLTKEVKPFIVSMGNVAASGGYYIACSANKIFSNPTTLTGSIGVFGVIPNTQKFFSNKLGVTFDRVKTNQYSDYISGLRPLTAEETQFMTKNVEDIYSVFTSRVAEGRNMQVADVDNIGQGRVWSGINAKQIGLVDEFGGLKAAVIEAANLASLDSYRVVEYPRKKEPIEILMESFSNMSETKLKNEFGEYYNYIQMIKQIKQMEGVQALMPQNYDIY
ncbi:MAG: signal peptide peptidase SppA [Bacteroidales bacterium]